MRRLLRASGDLRERRRSVLGELKEHPHLVIALSGGVDSAVLVALAVEAIGSSRVLAVTGRSAAVTDEEILDAAEVARQVGVRHEIIETRELENKEYLANRKDRCYHCRTELFKILNQIASCSAPARVAYGAILDDLGEDRPGMDAAREQGILAPLLDARLTKVDVRLLASEAGLRVGHKPANACLASRIPTGTPVTVERLDQVARAERGIRRLGFEIVRVRHEGDTARIELGAEDLSRLADAGLRASISSAVRAAGFSREMIDPAGYRPAGSRRAQARMLYSIRPQADGGQ